MWPATLPTFDHDHIFSALARHFPSLGGIRFHLLWLYYTLHHDLKRYIHPPLVENCQCPTFRQVQRIVDRLFWANDRVHRSVARFQETMWRTGQHAWEGLISTLAMGVGVERREGAVFTCGVIAMLCLVWLAWSVWCLQRHIQQNTCSCVRVWPTATPSPYPRHSESRTDRRHVHFTTDADKDDRVQLQNQSPSRILAPLEVQHLHRRLGGYLVPVRSAHWPEYYKQAIVDAMADEDGIIRLERKQVRRDVRDNVISFKRGLRAWQVSGVLEQTDAWLCDGIEWR